ncbi:MAG: discoidin domain-containing protein [Methylophilaceae bacterium]
MRKILINNSKKDTFPLQTDWLNTEALAEAELSSEDAAYPIEFALRPDHNAGWRAAEPGKQTIRLLFDQPQHIRRIRLSFVESALERTQEYVLRWSADGGQSFREVVRQQWNFSPNGATLQTEDYAVELDGLTLLELCIIPDIGNEKVYASLAQLLLA